MFFFFWKDYTKLFMRKVFLLIKQRRQRHLTSRNKKVSRLFLLVTEDHQPRKEDAIALSLSPSRSIFDVMISLFLWLGECVCVCVVVSFKVTSFFMRKVYLLIINVSTPHRESFKRKMTDPKTKKEYLVCFFFFFFVTRHQQP